MSENSARQHAMNEELRVRRRIFWTTLAAGVALGAIIGFVVGVNVADQVLVIPMGESVKV
jgi:hypothetical protein